MSGGLDGRVAIVTGGARGIGAAHVRALTGAGASVVIADVLDEAGDALVREVGPVTTFHHLDVRSEEGWASAVAHAEVSFGAPVSILVNNAGVNRPTDIADETLDNWNEVLGVNLTGTFLGIRAVTPAMERAGGGAIVNTASMIVNQHMNMMAAYSASKTGVVSLTRVAAIELAPLGIRVNAIHPGMIATDMTAGGDPEQVLPRIPLRRYGQPEDVATTMLFIVRDAAYATGSDFFVDGGIIAGRERPRRRIQ